MQRQMLDLIASICFIVVGIIFRIEAGKIRVLSFGSLGGDFFPKIMSDLLIILALMWFINAIKLFIKTKGIREAIATDAVKRDIKKKAISILAFLLLFCLLIYIFDVIGFVLFSFLLSLLTYVFLKADLNRKDILIGTLYSVFITLVIWFIFVEALGLVLPQSHLF